MFRLVASLLVIAAVGLVYVLKQENTSTTSQQSQPATATTPSTQQFSVPQQ